MARKTEISRRSFLGQVTGGVALTGAGALVTGCATSGQPRTGYTDRDGGRWADRAGHGRGPNAPRAPQPTQQQGGTTDLDPGDAPGRGRGGSRGSCTDSDTQATNYRTDPAGRGQRCR